MRMCTIEPAVIAYTYPIRGTPLLEDTIDYARHVLNLKHGIPETMLCTHRRIDVACPRCLPPPIFLFYDPAELELYVALPVSDTVTFGRLAGRSCDTLCDDADPSMIEIDVVTLRDSGHGSLSVMVSSGFARRAVAEHLLPRTRSVAFIRVDDEVSHMVHIHESRRAAR